MKSYEFLWVSSKFVIFYHYFIFFSIELPYGNICELQICTTLQLNGPDGPTPKISKVPLPRLPSTQSNAEGKGKPAGGQVDL